CATGRRGDGRRTGVPPFCMPYGRNPPQGSTGRCTTVMGRHSLPDQYGAGRSDPRPRARRRTVAVATALVLTVAGGPAAAARGARLSSAPPCSDDPLRLTLAASPDIAPALTAAARQARAADVTSDGRCLAVTVTARDSYKVADALATGRRT